MHGCNSASGFVVNAEVDSMGGVVESGVGIGTKTSPRCSAIEKVQAELRQEYDVLEERRRELEFLEKGGNPLDFNFGKAASVSVQSTSLTDQPPDLFLTSEAKGSFAFTASPHGDSVESSGRPGAHVACEPNSADNLMLFDGENDFVEGDRKSSNPSRTNSAPAEHSSKQDGSHHTREVGDSVAFSLPRKAYKRRSKPNRDGVRPSSNDGFFGRGNHGSFLSSQQGPKDAKVQASDEEKLKEQKVNSNYDSKPLSPNGVTVCKTVPSEGELETELDSLKAIESATNLIKNDLPDIIVSSNVLKDVKDDKNNQWSALDVHKSPEVAFEETVCDKGKEGVVPTGLECQPLMPVTQMENQSVSDQVNGFDDIKVDDKILANTDLNNSTMLGTKVLDSESCTQNYASLDGNNDVEMCTDIEVMGSNGNFDEKLSEIPLKPIVQADPMIEENKDTKVDDRSTPTDLECNSIQQSYKENGYLLEAQEEINEVVSVGQDMEDQNQNEVSDIVVESMECKDCNGLVFVTQSTAPLGDNLESSNENGCDVIPEGSLGSSVLKLSTAASPGRVPIVASDMDKSSDTNSNVNKVDEESILEEARTIEAKHKRIAELSVATLPMESRLKSHWDFVLEEMPWLANDFAQERIWKISAAARICHHVGPISRLRLLRQNNCREHKKAAHILARAVIEFWLSVEEKREVHELQHRKDGSFALREYAMRFLKHNSFDLLHSQAETPMTPDRVSDLGISGISWEDHLTEEMLFYTVLPGATENYRRSIESHVVKYEKTGSSMQEEVETSACDVVADFGSQDNVYDEDEGETSTYDASVAFDGSRSLRFPQKKWKNSTKAYNGRTYEVVADSPFMQCMENKAGNQQHVLMGKRPAGSLNVSFPTKRMRTSSNRQRVLSPFGAGTSGCVQMTTKTDASSGDTNSFQDDQSTMHGGSHIPNNLEVESVEDFEKQLPFDSAETSTKNKKKKKAKHLGSAYEHGWQVDTNFQIEQRDYSKKRSDGHQLESNGSSGLFGQHIAKKPKMMRQSLDNSFDSVAPVCGSSPSPVASQISNQNKIMKMLSSRDRGRKNKSLKMPINQPGSGSPWSLFEEQALVVLVHDLGPNWALVSDAINSTLQFKCIFRNPKECKNFHKMLMDRTGDGADSTEDSGSSQPYNSTLPGIPKGSARQLFQRLQGPIEEDTLRSHFDKIIMIGQKLHSRRKQDLKQLQPPHSSHMTALTQLCPNYLSGSVLTPLDLCDATTPSSDILPVSYQGQHTGGLAISAQASMAPMLNACAINSSVPGSSNKGVVNSLSSPPGPVSASVRDARYVVPRSSSLSTEEQQRMQQYNQVLPGRNLMQSNPSSPGGLPGNDRGVRMLPGGNAMGVTGVINRNLPIARPEFQGIASSPMLNSGNVISSMHSSVNVHPVVGSVQGSLIRPRDSLHLIRNPDLERKIWGLPEGPQYLSWPPCTARVGLLPSQNQDPQRQITGSELQIQASQGNSHGIATHGTLGSSFPNQTGSPPVSSYPLHQQSHGMSPHQPHVHHSHLQGTNHVTSPQHQAYAARLVKDGHLQHRMMQQQQQQQQSQQFASSNSIIPHVPPQSQIPISSPPQSSPPVQLQSSSPPVSLSPLTSASTTASLSQHQQKHQAPSHGGMRNAQASTSGATNQMSKPRQRQSQQQQQQQQQFQESGRHQSQQRQQTQSQQQAKVLKAVGRANMVMHQNVPIDPSLLNGLSTNPANQTVEKGEQGMHLLQGQGLYSGPTMNPVQSGKHVVPHSSNQSQPQQKIYPGQASPLAQHLQQIPSHSDTSGQGHVSAVATGPLSAGHQSVQPFVMASSNHQPSQVQSNIKMVNQNQSSAQKLLQHNRHMNSDLSSKLQGREAQTELNSTSNLSHVGVTATTPQTSNDAINGMQGLSSSGAHWRTSEAIYDSGTSCPATNLSSVGTPPAISAGNEFFSQVGPKGLGPRQSSGNLPPVGLDVGTHWQQQQPSQLQQPLSPVSQQPQLQSQQQLPQHQHSQQQAQLGGSSCNLFVRSSDSRLE